MGSEGDEIILSAFRQIQCSIPEEVTSIGVLEPNVLIEIVARSIRLITDGDAKYPIKLPPGMASRHRLCTDMSLRIKSMGYSGECGYNQLLYPTELTTRPILEFIVEKLPHSAEEEQEEVLSASALLSRRIRSALIDWDKKTYVHHYCPNICPGATSYEPRFRSLVFHASDLNFEKGAPPVTDQVKPEDIAPSLFERNCSLSLKEAKLEAELVNESDENTLSPAAKKQANKLLIKEALTSAAQSDVNDNMLGGDGGGDNVVMGKKAPTLAELLRELADDAEAQDKGNSKGGTRFTHATDFGQEHAGAGNNSALRVVGGGGGGDAKEDPEGKEGEAAATQISAAEAAKNKAEAEQRAREAELEELGKSVLETEALVAGGAREIGIIKDKTRQLESDLATKETEYAVLEKELLIKTKTLEMLPKAAENAAKLQEVVNASARKLQDLGLEWEKHRLPLISQLRSKRDAASGRKAKCKAMVEEMKKCRVEMQAMANEVRVKEEAMKLLSEELARMPKNVNRTLYTYRIMDIISSIAKQKKEIEKIISEISNVQKEINATGEKLSRAEALADEKIFSTAKLEANKKDPAMVAAYRHFSDIRSRFDELVICISDIGKRETETRGLESKTEQLAERVSKNNTERILSDLRQVQEENAGLIAQIRGLKGKV
jgi:hypothetical protein